MYSVYIAALIVSTHFLPSRTKPGKLLHLWTTRYEEALPISLNPEREIVHSSLYTVRGAFVCFSVSFRFPLPLAPALYSLFFFFFFSSSPLFFFYAFFFAAAAALAAFFWLLRIMTTPRKEPTTAEPTRTRMTGMRMAQTRGRKRE